MGLEDLQTLQQHTYFGAALSQDENPQILRIKHELALRGSSLPLWIMVETPTAC